MAVRLVTTDLRFASPETRAALRREVLAIQIPAYQASSGVSPAAAAARVTAHVDGALDVVRYRRFNTVILAYADGVPVACGLACAEVVTVDGGLTEIIRGGINVAPTHRNQRLVSALTIGLMRAYGLRALRSRYPRYYLGYCMSPVIYHFIARRVPCVLPSPEPSDPALAETYAALVGHEPRPVAEVVGSRTDPETEAWLARTDSPAARFFLSINPGFREGAALPILVPLRRRDLLQAALISIRSWLRRSAGARAGRWGALQKTSSSARPQPTR